jgi:CheY-like chemotaxis protein
MKGRPLTDIRLQALMREVEQNVSRVREQLQQRVEYAYGALDVWQKTGVTGLKGQILVVDGDREFRREMEEMVLSAGYQCDKAKNAVEATSYLQLSKYQLVIVDLVIPKGDGWQVMRQALHRFPGIKVVIIVRNNEQGKRAMRMGAFSFLIRPINQEQLRTCVLIAMKFQYRTCKVLLRGDTCNRSCVNHFLWPGDEGAEPEIEYVDTNAL